MSISAFLRGAALVASAVLSHAVLAADAAPVRLPVADFFTDEAFADAQFSPNGKYVAARVAQKGAHERLVVIDLATNAAKAVASFTDSDIGNFRWINDGRLLYSANDRDLAAGDSRAAPGLFAVNRDGSGYREVAMRTSVFHGPFRPLQRNVLPWHFYMTQQPGAQDSELVYLENRHIAIGELERTELLKVNTITGDVPSTVRVPAWCQFWMLDQKGEPRLIGAERDGVNTLYYLDPASLEWRKLAAFDARTGSKDAFTPLAFGPDGTLYVISWAGGDKSAVYAFDFKTNRIADQPLVALDGYDFNGELIMDQHKLLGLRYLTEGGDTMWFDPAMKAVQEKIDALLPGALNQLALPARPETPWVLVTSSSDIQPARSMLYNRDTQQLSPLGDSHPAIAPAQMAHKTLVHYKARDGLDIPAWLTLPQGSHKNLPLVVLVHGGPYIRGGAWDWRADEQFLASRGYAVLEPEYRGSTGYGLALFKAGMQQWGLKMQDDLADGARWAIAQGLVDGARVCIAGTGYGGYAALMGLINDAGLYKCGIDWAGMTDLSQFRDNTLGYQSSLPEAWKLYGTNQLIGDPVGDAARFKATSPLAQAARIKQPLLLAYGAADLRVPLETGTALRDALKDSNPQVEWLQYQEDGQGWKLPATRVDFWSHVEQFLDKNIGH